MIRDARTDAGKDAAPSLRCYKGRRSTGSESETDGIETTSVVCRLSYDGMDTPESKVHSFIVKLWLENADDETKRVAWRGYVTHVPDGERRYLKKLSDLVEFIKSYLNGVVRKPGLKERFKSWLRHLKMSL